MVLRRVADDRSVRRSRERLQISEEELGNPPQWCRRVRDQDCLMVAKLSSEPFALRPFGRWRQNSHPATHRHLVVQALVDEPASTETIRRAERVERADAWVCRSASVEVAKRC